MTDIAPLLAAAVAHHQADRLADAEALYRQVLAAAPDDIDALHLLGVLATQSNQHETAVALIRRAVALQPTIPVLHYNLGCALREALRPDEAESHFRQALVLQPDYPHALNNLGDILRERKAYPEAEQFFRQAIALDPAFADAWTNLGVVLKRTGRAEEAVAAHRRAITLRPDFAIAHNNLGNALLDAGYVPDALASLRHARALRPHDPEMHGNVLLGSFYDPATDPTAHFRDHQAYGARFPATPAAPPSMNNLPFPRPLRIGYVSPDFSDHSLRFFIEGLLAHHHPDRAEIFCYANVFRPDLVTARLQQSVLPAHWRDITRLSDVQAAAQIREDHIDILVDLAGHTARNRLPLFALHPAPIQATYLGYLGTTGLPAIQYRLTDAYVDPPGQTEHLHTETLVRLPHTFACYRPPQGTPAVSPPPALANGHITFASLNMLYKLSPEVLAAWARILHRLPTARLALITRGLEEPLGRSRLLDLFACHGISSSRLRFTGKLPLLDYFAAHAGVDILLDTFPINGHTITCNALWMGVPVVTLAGASYPTRLGCSVLSNLGLAELIAATPDDYIEKAVALASDMQRLADLRSSLRQRMQQSPLMNEAQFATELENAYNTLWHAHHPR
jgi:protein O-GlcNAc transferase